MQPLYNEIIKKVTEGSRFSVDLAKRCLKVDGKYVIKDGNAEGLVKEPLQPSEVIAEIEHLYRLYRESVPSERSDNKRRTYFRALREKDLSDEAMLYGVSRETAQISLELYILVQLLTDNLKWTDFGVSGWFWKSPNIDGLVILREWIDADYKPNKHQPTNILKQ